MAKYGEGDKRWIVEERLNDWPEIAKYAGLVCAQAHHQELIQELFKTWKDPVRGTVSGGMIMELLISFRRATGHKPQCIIFYRDGVSEGQFYQVLLYELDAIRMCFFGAKLSASCYLCCSTKATPHKGTSRPAHYHVLWDENKFTANALQSLTNNLCYIFEEASIKEAQYVSFVLVAGGLGERLGYNGIKVALLAETTTGTCFLQLYIKSILAL
ncbi:hypothetical protein J1N35_038593 [Gossypium stocksii]|uniref:Piwi domain-containing protein n=1 Tax=Gossypium stocksii TaxID=47602 RepID=A0A9D3ZMR3_9ROSI|nr:hypothetical protein J1N35_038593 [Gossypium stocksii]